MERFDLPAAFAAFADARKAGFLKVKAAKEQGKRVAGCFCAFTPLEILDAAGLLTVSLCGMSPETIPAAETQLPRNLCPLIKSSYGFYLTDKCPYTYFADLIVGETTCDGKKKMYELLGQGKEVYVLHLPQGVEAPYALSMWTSELRRFIAYLEEHFQITITDEALRAAIVRRNALRQARCRLMELLAADTPPISGTELYTFLDGIGFNFDVDDAIRKTCGLEAQIKWPNDVVVNGKKVCGILTEMSLESDYIHYVVVGTGINVNQESIPEELKETATSLSIEKGRKIVRADVLEHTIAAFEEYYETFMKTADLSMLADEYNEILVSRDKEVKVLDPKGEFSGISRGINKKGELLVELKDHSVRNIYAGEVSVRGLYGYV